MAADLGGSQISALLESVPGIVNVLRSPVADAIVNMIRAGAGVRPFSYQYAEELVQYAVQRGLIGAAEGDEVLEDVRSAKRGGRSKSVKTAKRPAVKKPVPKKPVPKKAAKPKNTAKKATAKGTRPARKSEASAKKKAVKKTKKKPAKKTAKKPQRGGKRR